MDLSIIIVNWNSAEHLRKCLASVFANTAGLEFEVIVVDNASFDGCGEMLAKQYPQVRFVQSQENLGFAGANNLGYAQCSGRTLLFLNPDTEVVGNAVGTLYAVLGGLPDAGVIGARLLNSDGTVQTSCIQRFPTVWNQAVDAEALRQIFPALRVWGTGPLLEKQSGPVPVEVISGACMMLRREAFERAGLFCTAYFMYCEDVDLCFQLHRAGFRNYYLDGAAVVHHGGASSSVNGQSHFSAVVMRDSVRRFFALRRGRLRAMAYRMSVVGVAVFRCAVLALGIVLAPGRSQRLRRILSRWSAVLRWGIGIGAA